MNINNRFCTLVGHEQIQATHICIFEYCKLLQRACCIQCINEGIHNHEKSDPEHIIQEQAIQNDCYKLKNDKNKNNQPIDFSKRKYNVKQIDSGWYCYRTAQISNDEKYLAYGGLDMILKIYNIQEDRIIKQIKFDRQIMVCQFTFDSSKLYVGCHINGDQEYAKVIVFDVQKNFKKIYQLNIFQLLIHNITIQNQYLITSHESKIIKIDIKRKKQLFKFIGQKDSMNYVIDYDWNNDFIMIGPNDDRSIKLWDCCRRRLIINKKQAHLGEIQQISFINNTQYVLSLDYSSKIYKWSIDLTNNNLIKLQEYEDHHMIFSFYKINQNQNLLLICENYVKIIDEKGQTINQIDLQWGGSSCIRVHRQLENARYIIIATYDKIRLAQGLE